MAKELPYFKFEPNAWENGNIQILSREDKGLFVDICSMFWSRLGDLPEKLVIQKLCNGNTDALKSLYEENIIENIEGSIYIKFLSIQLQEFENISNKNSENAKERWRKYHEQKSSSDGNATAVPNASEVDAIREDKIIEEEKREEKKEESIDFVLLLQEINKHTGRAFKTINDKVKRSFKARLKEGYTKSDIRIAITNACQSAYHMENGKQYLTPEFFSRSSSLDKYSTTSRIDSHSMSASKPKPHWTEIEAMVEEQNKKLMNQ